MYKHIIIGSLLAFYLSSCGETESPLKVEKQSLEDGSSILIVTNISNDNITIDKVTANRGNCDAKSHLFGDTRKPAIVFGDQERFIFGCDVIETEITTANAGTWTFTF